MKLGLSIAYGDKKLKLPMDIIHRAETAGFDAVWVPEAYGSDAVSIASWILAQTKSIKVGTGILQISARSPAMTAMTAMSLSQLSSGRFILGLGASGPQVVEGWHGKGYANSLQRQREYVEIIRKIMARKEPLSYKGDCYELPYTGDGSLGLGKPLKSILEATSSPIYTASFTPGGFRLAGEIADGVIPAFASAEKIGLITEHVEKGFKLSNCDSSKPKSWDNFDCVVQLQVYCADDPKEYQRTTREKLGLYIGGMGARTKNFYNAMACRMGYEEEAHLIQDLYLSGRKEEAMAAVPDELIEEIALIGNRDQIAEKAKKWKTLNRQGYVKSLCLKIHQVEMIEFLIEIFQD